MTWEFVIEGKPAGKARPRFGGYRVHMPKRYVEWRSRVERIMRWRWHGSDTGTREAIDVPVEVEVVIRTKSGNMKPDIDNAAGAYLDALQAAGVIANDGLVRRLVVDVQLSDHDHAVVSVREWRQ